MKQHPWKREIERAKEREKGWRCVQMPKEEAKRLGYTQGKLRQLHQEGFDGVSVIKAPEERGDYSCDISADVDYHIEIWTISREPSPEATEKYTYKLWRLEKPKAPPSVEPVDN